MTFSKRHQKLVNETKKAQRFLERLMNQPRFTNTDLSRIFDAVQYVCTKFPHDCEATKRVKNKIQKYWKNQGVK